MQNKITQAVILSAGLGTRLRPITDDIPKVMVPFAGKPLLEHHILQFKKHGVADFFINLHYLPDVIKNHLGDGSKWGVRIHYAFEPEILGTAGGMKNFEAGLNDVFFLIYGDMFSAVDYSRMSDAFFKKEPAIGMMIVAKNDHPQDSDLVELDEHKKFIRILRKPHERIPEHPMALEAAYIFKKRILSYVPGGKYYEIDHMLLPDIIKKGEAFYGYETTDFLKDIGTMERYKEVQEHLSQS